MNNTAHPHHRTLSSPDGVDQRTIDLAYKIGGTLIDEADSSLEYILRRGFTAMGCPPDRAVLMLVRLAECQLAGEAE